MKWKRIIQIIYVLAFAGGAAANTFAAAPHRYHASLTRMDYNAANRTFEITIQLFIHDLVPVIERQYKRKLDLDKTGEGDELILDYLNRTFILKNKNGETKKLNWVGKELDVEKAFVHVEIPMPEGIEGASLQNIIFFETFVEQTNRVNAHFGQGTATLLFVPGDKAKAITPVSDK